jgi:hypothetical protein
MKTLAALVLAVGVVVAGTGGVCGTSMNQPIHVSATTG